MTVLERETNRIALVYKLHNSTCIVLFSKMMESNLYFQISDQTRFSTISQRPKTPPQSDNNLHKH